ncbi:plastocyanin/azurin family copper-binding protein [Bradyrhizobium sp. ERR14]|uniref:plastocyanin/azurin family copper-binding protein n=1 Tax=Bradyrhizobium sp. ERR14 TaxID=2663837 RepID=UPI0016166C7A
MAAHTVEIKDFAYNPSTLVIVVGDSVKWANKDSSPHTATRNQAPTFDTGPIPGGNPSGDIVFTDASDSSGFAYICTPHPFMQGKIIVTLPGSNRASYSRSAALEQHSQAPGGKHKGP